MDMDMLKSAAHEDHVETMMMMMQMDKTSSDFSGAAASASASAYHDVGDMPTTMMMMMMEFNHRSDPNMILDDIPHVVSSPPPPPPTFTNRLPSSTISFSSSNPVQEPTRLPFLSGSNIEGNNDSLYLTQSLSESNFKRNSMAAMREMIFRIAAMQPVHIDPESVKPPKRRNVRISKDPQSVAARHRRERISERIRILQRLVPGGTKMDTASMLDEAIHYVKFLKKQVQSLERAAANRPAGIGFPVPMSTGSYPPTKAYESAAVQNVLNYSDA